MVSFIKALASWFSLKNLGAPHYFLGIEIIPTQSGLFLSQHKFIKDILEKFDMGGGEPSLTLLSYIACLYHWSTAISKYDMTQSFIYNK